MASALVAAGIPCISAAAATPRDFGNIPLHFELNRGQADSRAQYIARSPGAIALIRQDGLTLARRGGSVSMTVVNAGAAVLTGETPLPGVSNYYYGSLTLTGVPHYGRVRARGILPHIDLLYYASGRQIEYDFVVHPGADATSIALRFDGSARPTIDANGDLLLRTPSGILRQSRPAVWQEVAGRRRHVDCRYAVLRSGEVRLEMGDYNRAAGLVIDPILSYSTYVGGTGDDVPTGIAVDGSGDAFITGYTMSTDFQSAMGTNQGGNDVFVAKLNPAGTALVYSTYIGSSGDDEANAIAVDGSGNAYITGYTTQSTFPKTVGSFGGGKDAFVVKLGTTGTLSYSTIISGSGDDWGTGIAVDTSGNAYVSGVTASANFTNIGGASLRSGLGGSSDAFAAKVASSGQITYAKNFGGSGADAGNAIAIDSSGNAYITGSTTSPDFPLNPGGGSLKGTQDAFITVLDPSAATYVYSLYLGGSGIDTGTGIAVDSAKAAYVTGTTTSGDFPITGGFSATKPNASGAVTGFVWKVNSTGSSVAYSSYLGGTTGTDSPAGIAVDSNGRAYVTGTTTSSDFPATAGALRTSHANDTDIFMAQVKADGSALSYATLLGSSGNETGRAISLDQNQGVYVTGTTTSYTVPTSSTALGVNNPKPGTSTALNTGLVMKIDMSSATSCTASVMPASANVAGQGGPISFMLTLPSGCPWEAVADPFVTLTGFTRGLGSSSPISVGGTVAINGTGAARTGTVKLGNAIFTINQDAASCQDVTVSPLNVFLPQAGGFMDVNVTLPAACSWTASSNALWATLNSNGGTGSGTVRVTAASNSFAMRTGTLNIAGKTVNVSQAGGSCTGSASTPNNNFAGQGGTGVVRLTTFGSGCNWTAYTNVPWIQIPGTQSGQGTGGVGFTVSPNPGLMSRSGLILIGDQFIVISQSAGPAGVISSYNASIFAGSTSGGSTADAIPATSAMLSLPQGLYYDNTTRSLYIADVGSGRLRIVTPDGNINTVAGGGASTADNIIATTAALSPNAVWVDDATNSIYVTDASRVRRVTSGIISTVAGTLNPGYSGDNGPATMAQLNNPSGVAVNSAGDLFITDQANGRIRKVSGGMIATIAGGGSAGLGDNGPATNATLIGPVGLTIDNSGNLYFADPRNNRIREVAGGTITTVAGGGSGGDGVPPTQARLVAPQAVTFDALGNLLIADTYDPNHWIRKVMNGTISTLTPAGTFFTPIGIAADPAGDVYFSDGNVVRELTPVVTPCTYSVSSPGAQPIGGGMLMLTVTAAAGCNWSTSSDLSWVTVNQNSGTGTGNGTVSLTLAASGGTVRTGTIFVAGQAVTILQGNNSALGFFPLTPCRTVDTRPSQGKSGPFGPPPLAPYVSRDFPLAASGCGLPQTAQAYSLNFTVVPPGPLDFLSAWPAAQPYPGVSTLNSPDGAVIANAAVVPVGSNGAISVVAGQTTDLIIDTNGYFAPPNGSELAFYLVPPCRIADTRADQNKPAPFGAPALVAYQQRDFPIQASSCGIPNTASAYSLNMTVVPQGRLDFLSTWPTGQTYPGVSTLNAPDGSIVANAAIVPAGTNGAITVVAGNPTDFILDINGYFGAPNLPGALHYYTVTPCRVADTRTGQGKSAPFGPPSLAAYTTREFPIRASNCNVPSTAQAYALNITVVPQGPLSFLSAWPAGQTYPGVSTLNSPKGTTLANMAIVGAGTNGAISIVAGNPTDVIIDVNGYFAP